MKFSIQSPDNVNEELERIEKEREKKWEEFNAKHVWNFRKEPPPHFAGQTINEEAQSDE